MIKMIIGILLFGITTIIPIYITSDDFHCWGKEEWLLVLLILAINLYFLLAGWLVWR